MRSIISAVAALALAVAGSAAAKDVSFATDIVPILKKRCAICHLTGQEAGHLALHPKAAHGSLFKKKSEESKWLLVDPGQPAKSYLLMKLDGTHLKNGGKGARMPFAQTPLASQDIDLFKAWIAAGAPKN
ncbi:MAG: hypothetical protein R3E04_11130 [Sphingobium sp.]